MLGIVLLYWIGKYFYKLAEIHDKSKWGFAVIGIVGYYTVTIVLAITFVIVAEIISPGYLDTVNRTVIDLISVPFGLLGCYVLYKYIKKTWEKKGPINSNNIDEIGRIQE